MEDKKQKIQHVRKSGITINTDASFCGQTKRAGWAFWIVCDKFRIIQSGKFNAQPANSIEAEIMCIGNAIATLLKRDDLAGILWVLINTDCLQGVSHIKKGTTAPGKHHAVM